MGKKEILKKKIAQKANSNFPKTLILGIIIFGLFIYLLSIFQLNKEEIIPITYSQFLQYVKEGNISSAVIIEKATKGRDINGKFTSGKLFTVYAPEDPALFKLLDESSINYEAKPEDTIVKQILSFVPFVLFIFLIWLFFIRQMQTTGNKALSFGKSRARMASNDKQKVTFKDVAGVDEAKEELQEIIDFLKNPQKFQKLGGKIPKGVLVVGPPGTGKTLLAKAVAGEANVPFFSISGSDFVEMFVGVGAARVRDLFDRAKRHSPCIIFVDEIDAVGRQRFAGLGGGHDEREQTLNQLLSEMDGFDTKAGVILIAATNRPDVLDPALLRPGRFDRSIVVDIPDIKGREEILKVHIKNVKLDNNIDLKVIARQTPGFSGADLANLVNEAALLAARRNKQAVSNLELEEAIDRVMAGPEKKSRVISEREKKLIAYHESGHTVLAHFLPFTDPVHKISIIPRGIALGYTLQLPLEDRLIMTKEEIIEKVTVLLGGRIAENIFFKESTTGARNDLRIATETVQRMITEYGMSEKLGPMTLGKKNEQVFLGRDIVKERDFSEAVASEIDEEMRRIINECYKRGEEIIKNNKAKIETLAKTLLEKEVLDAQEIEKILGKSPKKNSPPLNMPVKDKETKDTQSV
ncbi:MAG: ATP-dependent zinc metalloprotease FtsH [Candidatus Ratteibacteria bacterium]|nr:ATP-dependent zinc metalloprotease FtsH [Candidatus Ratteibacteria bacterium]